MHKSIEIKKSDILPLLYFIISMFQQESTHRQGTSSKSDLIGGYIDRWINKIPEEILFSKLLLKDKPYSVINDYFVYGSGSEKNAPDVLGLKKDTYIYPFAKYYDTKWNHISEMPYIEIKTFRKNQKMVSVRDTQLGDENYYIFVESDLHSDYLIKLFDTSCFTPEIKTKVLMDETFIDSNSRGLILQPPTIVGVDTETLGTLSLIRIIKGADFKKRATLCRAKESVMYLKNISQVSRITARNCDLLFSDIFSYNKELDMYSAFWEDKKCISMYATNTHSIKILKRNKKSFYCETSEACSIYNYNLEANSKYKIELGLFERNSSWNEYVALKNQFAENLDKTYDLLDIFDKIAEQ